MAEAVQQGASCVGAYDLNAGGPGASPLNPKAKDLNGGRFR